jgi:preprotein translocase subunit SecA
MEALAANRSPTDWMRGRTRDDARLWPMLAAPRSRRMPPRGLDVYGELVTGWFERRRARKLDWARAHRIEARAAELKTFSEAAFDDEVSRVRGEAVVSRDDPRAVDAAFAVAFEAIRREIGLTLHPEQVLGALALSAGCCAELATGEGKTVTAILAAALDGWSGRGVHVITVNDYLARRDAEITSPAYRRLGLSVGIVQESSTPEARRRAYGADITYAADKQVLFDYLKDRLAAPLAPRLTGLLLDQVSVCKVEWSGRVVQRGLYAAIVDEADSVLIDDAVTPAIISGPRERAEGETSHYVIAAEIARRLDPVAHYEVDSRLRRVGLTDAGRAVVAEAAASLPAFWSGPRRREEVITTALLARELYQRGEDYIVREGEVLIIDRSTGRILPGRQWHLGIHQAIEAKEGLSLTAENATLARSSYQQFFQKYTRLAGMTGTASEVADELWRWYHLPVVPVPTHRPVRRTTAPDRVFLTDQEKMEAAAARVKEAHEAGRPVLVGTWSVVASERMGKLLRSLRVPCEVLNATREGEEADIIARAGRRGAVTVATNMAGRGTDIQLDDESRAAGGLLVLATERHDESRVDRQLAGRSGRQGDPGAFECFVSLEDQLIARHGLPAFISLVKRSSGRRRDSFARLLWRSAQKTASAKWAIVRAESARSEAWFDMAVHGAAR